MYWRLNRAHSNVCENIPLFAAVVVPAVLLDCTSNLFGLLCVVYVVARVAQSVAHVLDIIPLRFAFFSIQMVSLTVMALSVFQQASSPHQH